MPLCSTDCIVLCFIWILPMRNSKCRMATQPRQIWNECLVEACCILSCSHHSVSMEGSQCACIIITAMAVGLTLVNWCHQWWFPLDFPWNCYTRHSIQCICLQTRLILSLIILGNYICLQKWRTRTKTGVDQSPNFPGRFLV